jgi:hypothetical protein
MVYQNKVSVFLKFYLRDELVSASVGDPTQ